MSYVGNITAGGSTHLVASTLYGTCTTAANVAEKVVICDDFDQLITGVTIHVKFTNSNTIANPTLNINSTGAINIYRYGTTRPSTSTATSWNAGAVISFTYDGSGWIMNDWLDTNTTYTSLPNPNALTLQLNGTTNKTYDGSSAQTFNVTADEIGALPLTGGTLSGVLSAQSVTCNGMANDAGFRLTNGTKDVMLREDENTFYILISDKVGETWNALRPFTINLSTGICNISGTANAANKAIGDSDGNQINTTYSKTNHTHSTLQGISTKGAVDMNTLAVGTLVDTAYSGTAQTPYNTPLGSSTDTSWFTVLTMATSGTRTTQIATAPFGHQQRMFVRFKHDATWSSWFDIYTSKLKPYVTGSFAYNNTSVNTINLGFQPSEVIVIGPSWAMGSTSNCVNITSTGFTVASGHQMYSAIGSGSGSWGNYAYVLSGTCKYIAFR